DTAILVAYLFVYSYEADAQVKALLFLPVIEAAFMFGLRGGLLMPVVMAPFLTGAELFRHSRFGVGFTTDHVTFPVGLELLIGADVFPAGSFRPIEGSVLHLVLQGQTVYREDMTDARYPEERDMAELGLRSRLCAPLLLGARAVGMLSVVRARPASFSEEEIE